LEIDPHIFRVLGLFLAILSPRKPPKLNIHFGYLPPTATLLGNVKLSIFYHFSLFGLVAQGAPPPYPQNVDKKRVFFLTLPLL